MNITSCSLGKWARLAAVLVPAFGLWAQAPAVSGLPEQVTGIQTPVPFTGPIGPTYTTFNVVTPATGTISTANNPYNVWCFNPYAYIQGVTDSYTAYNSYDSNFLALSGVGASPTVDWQEINWLINHKTGESGTLNPTVTDIELIIDDILIPGYDTADLSADGAQLLSDAQQYGPGFVPGPGQLLAIALYNAGINPNDGQNSIQDMFLEYPLPTTPQTPGLKLVKSASVSSAKCFQQVTYTYTVTNTGNVTLTNIAVTDDNATPGFGGDDFQVGVIASLAPGASQTFTRTVSLPITEFGIDSNGNSWTNTLITKTLPNGNIQITYVEDQSQVENSYGFSASPDWGNQGNQLYQHLSQDAVEFQFTDGAGNTVLDFAADYASVSGQYPSGIGTGGYRNGAGQLYQGNASNIVSVDTSLTDNLNQGNNGGFTWNSAPPGYKGWEFKCTYTVVVKSSCFGRNGFGQCNIKNVQHSKCKSGGSEHHQPTPLCGPVTNTATATATAVVNGVSETLTATDTATVQLNAGCTNCQPQQQCHCGCWGCQHGQHCGNSQCGQHQPPPQQCQHGQPSQCQQGWIKQCGKLWQQCGKWW